MILWQRHAALVCGLAIVACDRSDRATPPPAPKTPDELYVAKWCPDLNVSAFEACSARLQDPTSAANRAANSAAPPKPIARTGAPGAIGWATLRAPSFEQRTTPAGRIQYWSMMAEAQPGEPPGVDAKTATSLLADLRKELAEPPKIPLSAITVKIGETGGSIKVQPGVTAIIGEGDNAHAVGVCSPGIFGIALMNLREKLLASGVRALTCVSDKCGGTYNLRPDASPYFLMNGEACADLKEVLDDAFR